MAIVAPRRVVARYQIQILIYCHFTAYLDCAGLPWSRMALETDRETGLVMVRVTGPEMVLCVRMMGLGVLLLGTRF